MNSPSFNQQLPTNAMFQNQGGDVPGGFGFVPSPGFACSCGCGGLGACAGPPPDVVTPDSLVNAAQGILASDVPFSGTAITVDESAYATTVSPESVCETIAAFRAAAAQAYTPSDRDELSAMVLTFGAALAIRKVSCDPCALDELREKSADGDAVATAILQGVATMTASDAKRIALVVCAEAAVGNPWAEGQIIGLSQAAECGDLFAQNVITIVEQIFPQGLPTCAPCSPLPSGAGFPNNLTPGGMIPGQYGGPPMSMGGGAGAGYSTRGMPQVNNGPVMTPASVATPPVMNVSAQGPMQSNLRAPVSPLNAYMTPQGQ